MQEKNYLTCEEISVGVAKVTEEEVELYLKVDPRIIMDRLDEQFGSMGWTKDIQIEVYQTPRGFVKTGKCTISVWDETTKSWISRSDYGSPAPWAEEHEDKVITSDALKRAATNFGIGRELYGFENIKVPASTDENANVRVFLDKETGKWYTAEKFELEQIGYGDNYRVDRISIKNSKGVRVFVENRERTVNAKKTITPELGQDNASVEDLVVDIACGYQGQKLTALNPDQLLWVYSNTKDVAVKKGCLSIAATKEAIKRVFQTNGIRV